MSFSSSNQFIIAQRVVDLTDKRFETGGKEKYRLIDGSKINIKQIVGEMERK